MADSTSSKSSGCRIRALPRVGSLASLYPAGITIGRVTFVGQLDADLYQNVQIASDVDFSSLDSVLVLVGRRPAPELP